MPGTASKSSRPLTNLAVVDLQSGNSSQLIPRPVWAIPYGLRLRAAKSDNTTAITEISMPQNAHAAMDRRVTLIA
jgi:hypothetical protein